MNFRLKIYPLQFFIFAILISFSSCVSYKNIPYFQDLNESQNITEDIKNYSPHTIQPQDELLININSLNPDASVIFNNSLYTSPTNYLLPVYDYLVDPNGEIKLPIIGQMKVSGLTIDELAVQLNQRVLPYLKEPKVTVRFINFKVAVMGDVMRPNVYSSYSERLTITEALSLAGDLNITAKRNNIILVREKNGKREFFHVDLTSKNIFESPYFYLQSNDLIFVQPSKLKVSTLETAGYRNVSLIVSALSVVVTVAYLVYHK